MKDFTLSDGAERLWRLLAHYGATPYTAPGWRAADEWLAQTLAVTERTVRRYRAALVAAGILVERLNEMNEVEFRLRRLPAPTSLSPTEADAIARLMQNPEEVSTWLLQWFRWLMEQNGIASETIETYYRLFPPRTILPMTLQGDGTEASHTGQPMPHPTVSDGTRDRVSHQIEDSGFMDSVQESESASNTSDHTPSSFADSPSPAPRHLLRSMVESFGVFPDAAHAIANRLVQTGYTQAETKRLLDHLWQETRGQVGLLVYRLTKRPLPPRHAVQTGQWRNAPYKNEREARTKRLFRDMLD